MSESRDPDQVIGDILATAVPPDRWIVVAHTPDSVAGPEGWLTASGELTQVREFAATFATPLPAGLTAAFAVRYILPDHNGDMPELEWRVQRVPQVTAQPLLPVERGALLDRLSRAFHDATVAAERFGRPQRAAVLVDQICRDIDVWCRHLEDQSAEREPLGRIFDPFDIDPTAPTVDDLSPAEITPDAWPATGPDVGTREWMARMLADCQDAGIGQPDTDGGDQ